MVRALLSTVSAVAIAKTVHLATFDGVKETTLPFVPVNDPVMGGQSKSSFAVESGKGIFEGEVKVVPFLQAPGFCNLEAPGYRQQAISFPDISGTDGIMVDVNQTLPDGLTNWDVSIQTQTSKKASRTGDAGWQADFTFVSGKTQYFVPYSAFTCSSRGRTLSNCGDLSAQLTELTQLGLGSDGVAGPFRLEINSIDATSAPQLQSGAEIRLASFDGVKETTLSWKKTLDPVMGGASTGEFNVADGVGRFSGRCNIVKSLAAPGFAKIEGTGGTLADITSSDSILLKVRSSTPDYQGFKVAFGAPGVPSTTIFQRQGSYKTEFYLAQSNDWQIVQVPLTNFSRDTSDYTGRCDTKDPRIGGKQHYCCSASPLTPSKDEVCIESKYLSLINDLQIWAEGVEGDFDLEIEWIGAQPTSEVSELLPAADSNIALATFGASDTTYRKWKQQNDPVMGGASSGKFSVGDGVGTMEGTCAIIPRLKVPGFIKTSASGTYGDVSSCTGIELEVRSDSDYKGYRFDFGNDASACGKFFARGYKAPFTAPVGSFGKVQIPFNEFSRCWDDGSGEILKSCAEDPSLCPTKDRLQNLQSLSLWAEGVEGDVKIDIKSVGAYGCSASAVEV